MTEQQKPLRRKPAPPAVDAAAIQHHGVLFGLDPRTLAVTHISANADDFLGHAAEALLGTPIAELVDDDFAAALTAFAPATARDVGPFGRVVMRGKAVAEAWHAASHRAGGAIVVEAVPDRSASPALDGFLVDASAVLRAIGDNTGVGATAAAIARNLRTMTDYDRVLVVRFDDAGHGDVIAESKAPSAGPSIAGFRLHAAEMPAAARVIALRNPIRMIVDLAAAPVPVLQAGAAGGAPIDLSEAVLRAPQAGQVRLLTRLGAQAAVLMTLAYDKRMWGLVVFLHRAPRRLPLPHRATLQLMSDAIAVRLAAAEDLERDRERARRNRALESFRRALEREQGEGVAAILRRHAKALLRVVGADGLWCQLPDSQFEAGQTPPPEVSRRIAALCRVRCGSGVFATDHVAGFDPALAPAAAAASGALFMPLPRTRATLLFLRGEAPPPRTPDAGGNRFLAERAEAWRRERERHSVPWSAADLAVAPGAAEAVDGLAPRLAERRNVRRVHENEAKLRAILDATQDGLIVMDAGGRVLDFSGGAERLFGWAASEIVGQPAERLLPEALRAAHRTALANATSDLAPRIVGADGKLIALRKDGSTFPLEMTLTSIVIGGERMFVGALRDIADRLGLAQRDRFWFEHSTIGYSVSDPFSQRRLRVNPALCNMLGFSEEELLAKDVYDTTHADDLSAATDWRERIRAGSDEPLRRVQRLLRKDGKVVWARVTAMPMRYPGSETVHVVAEIVDVTELMEVDAKLRTALARAEAASAAKSQFLATMSHELRTPLNAIIGMSEMITAEIMGPIGHPRYAEYIGDIHKAGRHLLDLVTDVLDASRIESGGYRLAPVPLAMGEVIDETYRIVAPLAAARGVVLERRVSANLPAVRADRRALKQVLINVISNAIKFTPEKGLIAIRAAVDFRGGVEVTVADNGSGIAPEHLPHVTEPFYRAGDAYTAGAASGAGLGLSIAHGLVHAHGGTLDIVSHVGRGTTVTLRFPPVPAAA